MSQHRRNKKRSWAIKGRIQLPHALVTLSWCTRTLEASLAWKQNALNVQDPQPTDRQTESEVAFPSALGLILLLYSWVSPYHVKNYEPSDSINSKNSRSRSKYEENYTKVNLHQIVQTQDKEEILKEIRVKRRERWGWQQISGQKQSSENIGTASLKCRKDKICQLRIPCPANITFKNEG